jgi:hypothetical protein
LEQADLSVISLSASLGRMRICQVNKKGNIKIFFILPYLATQADEMFEKCQLLSFLIISLMRFLDNFFSK